MKKYLLALLVIPLLLYGCGTTVSNSGSSTLSAQFSGKVSQYDYSSLAVQSVKAASVSTVNTTPLAGATVKIEETLATTVTDGSGNFSFSEVPSGDFTLEVTREGYIPITITTNANEISRNVITNENFFPMGDIVFYDAGTTITHTYLFSSETFNNIKYFKWIMKNNDPASRPSVIWMTFNQNSMFLETKYGYLVSDPRTPWFL